MTNVTLTPELLVSIFSALLSLAFAYVPKVKDWYDARTAQEKAGIMALCLIVISVVVFVANCGSFLSVVNLMCNQQGAVALLSILFTALMANQGTYMLAVRPYQPSKPAISA